MISNILMGQGMYDYCIAGGGIIFADCVHVFQLILCFYHQRFAVKSGLQFFFYQFLLMLTNGFYIARLEHTPFQQPFFIIFYRVFYLPGFKQFFGYVFGATGFFMATHSEAEALNQVGLLIFDAVVSYSFNRVIYCQYIIT